MPTIHQTLLKYDPPLKGTKIRFIRSCSASLSPSVFHSMEKLFNAPVLEAYAMSEAAHQMASNPLPPKERKPGSVGIAQGVEIKIYNEKDEEVEEGEVCIKGKNVIKGYLCNDEANLKSFTKQGFFRTGDVGKFDNGFLFLTGRIKEIIIRGGEKISPLEVDNALLDHSLVSEAVSFGVPDEKYGQEVHAVVVPVKGKELREDEFKEYLKGSLADFKIPKKVYFVKEIPKSATGKIQRRLMVDAFFKP